MGKIILDVNNLSVSMEDKEIINNFSLSIEENTTSALLCPNKCGKTTLIKTSSGIIDSNNGKISVNDILLSKKNFKDYIISISTILEDIENQFLCNKVKDELRYPLENLSYDDIEIVKIIDDVSDTLKISTILGKDISRLDYFEKVKTLVAASIIHKPKLLFVDDILRFLSLKEKKEIIKIFKLINSKYGIAILFTTSDINDVIGMNHIIVTDFNDNFFIGNYSEVIKKDNELTKMGFDIPIMIDLSRKLEFYNLVDEIYYDEDRLVDKLWN